MQRHSVGGGLAIRYCQGLDVHDSIAATSAIALEEALLPLRWATLALGVVAAFITRSGTFLPVATLIVVTLLFSATVSIFVHRRLHLSRLRYLIPVGDGLIAVAALLVAGGAPSPYTPLFTLVLASIGIRLHIRRALALGAMLLVILGFGLHYLPHTVLSPGYPVFASFSLLIVWLVTILVRHTNRYRLSLDNLSRLVLHFPYGVIIEDDRGLYANAYVHKALGVKPPAQESPYMVRMNQQIEERVQRVWSHISERPLVQSIDSKESSVPMHEVSVPLDGDELRTFAFQLMPLQLATGKVARVATLVDVTEERSLQQRLQEQERLRLIGTLTTMAIHEVRNPLAAIRATAQLISHDDSPDVARRHATRITTMVDELHAFLERLMDLGRVPVVQGQYFEPGSVLREVTTLMTPVAHRSGVTLQLDDWAPGATLVGDPHALRQVLVNLVQNAIDVTPHGGVVRIQAEEDDGSVLFSVADEGPGIPADVAARLFDAFYTTKEKGTGLGLVISNQIVLEHRGKLWFEPQEIGTVFFVRLPSGSVVQLYTETS